MRSRSTHMRGPAETVPAERRLPLILHFLSGHRKAFACSPVGRGVQQPDSSCEWSSWRWAPRSCRTLTRDKRGAKNVTNLRRNSLAIHPSVLKRHRQSLKRRARNVESKSKLRTLIKKARQAIDSHNLDSVSAQIRAVNRELGKAISKGIIKRNTASRWLARLSRSASRPANPS